MIRFKYCSEEQPHDKKLGYYNGPKEEGSSSSGSSKSFRDGGWSVCPTASVTIARPRARYRPLE